MLVLELDADRLLRGGSTNLDLDAVDVAVAHIEEVAVGYGVFVGHELQHLVGSCETEAGRCAPSPRRDDSEASRPLNPKMIAPLIPG
jgi:hypothetical protein